MKEKLTTAQKQEKKFEKFVCSNPNINEPTPNLPIPASLKVGYKLKEIEATKIVFKEIQFCRPNPTKS